jgi:bifunctional non-homologous end joining protein LigD
MGLKEYQAKRDFERTPEPEGEKKPSPSGRLFVVQKHAARRLHYDFRLELDGVLKSWAVPKGPSLDPGERRLAVEVEDHPVDYGSFEGAIPEGEYGGGTVLLWDRGEWEPLGDPHKALKKGSLKFRLEGEKLRGGWTLVRMKEPGSGGKKNWLLIKETDQFADREADITAERGESVSSGRTIEEIAAEPGARWEGKGHLKRIRPWPNESARKARSPRKAALDLPLRED